MNLGNFSNCITSFSGTIILFLGVEKYCQSSLLLISVSTLFVVVRFDIDEYQIRAIVDALQSIVLILFVIKNSMVVQQMFFLGVGRASWSGYICRHILSPFPYYFFDNDLFKIKKWTKLIYFGVLYKDKTIMTLYRFWRFFYLTPPI